MTPGSGAPQERARSECAPVGIQRVGVAGNQKGHIDPTSCPPRGDMGGGRQLHPPRSTCADSATPVAWRVASCRAEGRSPASWPLPLHGKTTTCACGIAFARGGDTSEDSRSAGPVKRKPCRQGIVVRPGIRLSRRAGDRQLRPVRLHRRIVGWVSMPSSTRARRPSRCNRPLKTCLLYFFLELDNRSAHGSEIKSLFENRRPHVSPHERR